MAQDAPPPETGQTDENPALKPLQEEVARLTLEKQRAEALKAITEANKATLAAKLPQTETTGKKGDVTVGDGAGYYAELMAYRTLGTSAEEIKDRVRKITAGKTVIVTDEADLSQQAALWEVIHLKIERFQDEFDRLVKGFDERGEPKTDFVEEGVVAAAATLTSFLGAAADIAAFFKVDLEIKNRAVTLSKRALVAEVAQRLVPEAKEVQLPDLAVAGERALIHELDAAQGRQGEIATRLSAVRKNLIAATKDRETKKASWEKLKKDKAPAADIGAAKQAMDDAAGRVQQLTDRATRFETLITAFDTFFDALTTAPAAGGKSPLESVAVVDLVRRNAGLLLYLDIPSQGAEIHVTKSVWSSGRISYIGGSVAVFFLVDPQGKVLAAGSLPRSDGASFKGKEGSGKLPRVAPPEASTTPASGGRTQGGGA